MWRARTQKGSYGGRVDWNEEENASRECQYNRKVPYMYKPSGNIEDIYIYTRKGRGNKSKPKQINSDDVLFLTPDYTKRNAN